VKRASFAGDFQVGDMSRAGRVLFGGKQLCDKKNLMSSEIKFTSQLREPFPEQPILGENDSNAFDCTNFT
jgi:hypothetical protein